MSQAIHTATGQPVNVIAVRGGWSTIRDAHGHEAKVRNSALQRSVEAFNAAAEQILARAPRAKDQPAIEIPTMPKPQPLAPLDTPKYTGSMTVLRDASKAYQMGENGNPHCGDGLAAVLATLGAQDVIDVLLVALGLDANPYLHLNVGQQSMNLRNKARGAIKRGALTIATVVATLEALN